MDLSNSIYLLVGGATLLAASSVLVVVHHRRETNRLRREADAHAERLLADARRQADDLIRESRLLANEEVLKLREQTEQYVSRRRLELDETEKRVSDRERLVNQQLERLVNDEERLRQRGDQLQELRTDLERQIGDNSRQRLELREELARIARLSHEEAKAVLLRQAAEDTRRDAAELTRHIVEDAQMRGEERARHILATVLQRYAGEFTFESTTASVAIHSDEIKGRIIGREGRNIRAFETATGVTVLIDDTPNAVVISGFDPVRRAIAREAMARLIADGRIHPTRIEEIVAQVQREMEDSILRLGEEAVAKLGLAPVHVETARLLGRLRFRHSYSQNILDHSIEVATLAGLIAAELGADTEAAKRAGLLHDIGKAVTHEIEGPHAIVGADLIRQHGEEARIVNAVASHHQEVESEGPLGVLVSAADAISASRPGARSETLTTYIKRVEDLERIAMSFDGVEKVYAVQAGREVRVMVQPDEINDAAALKLAADIVKRIESELQYPGQIRVTVIRETRCSEVAT